MSNDSDYKLPKEEKNKEKDLTDATVEFDRTLEEWITKAKKRAAEQLEKEEKVKKKAKVFTKILEWYVIISAIIISLLLLALIGKGLYWIFANLFHGLASTFS